MNKDLIAIFDYLEKEKGIKREIIIKAIEEALVVAARKSVKGSPAVSVQIDSKSGEIEVYAEKEIVQTVTYPDEEISLEEALEVNAESTIGQWLNIEITPSDFGRIAAQTARQVISQKLRGAERDVIYEEYRHRTNEILSGTVKRIVRGATLIVDLGKVEAILPDRFYPKTERYQVGDRIQALLLEVQDTENGGAEVVLSRNHPEMVKQLFIQEVPELSDSTIEIQKIVREAGYRSKLSVSSNDSRVDPLGACVGVRGTRVKNVIRELNNEKIDIVIHTDDKIQLMLSLIHPIEPKKMNFDKENNLISMIVDDEDYPIIIGKRGMNARLNAALVEVELEVKKASEHQTAQDLERQLMKLEERPELDVKLNEVKGINAFVLDSLIEAGLDTPRKVLDKKVEEISDTTGISKEMIHDVLEKIHKIKA